MQEKQLCRICRSSKHDVWYHIESETLHDYYPQPAVRLFPSHHHARRATKRRVSVLSYDIISADPRLVAGHCAACRDQSGAVFVASSTNFAAMKSSKQYRFRGTLLSVSVASDDYRPALPNGPRLWPGKSLIITPNTFVAGGRLSFYVGHVPPCEMFSTLLWHRVKFYTEVSCAAQCLPSVRRRQPPLYHDIGIISPKPSINARRREEPQVNRTGCSREIRWDILQSQPSTI